MPKEQFGGSINRRQLLFGAAATLPLLHPQTLAAAATLPLKHAIHLDLLQPPDSVRVFLGDTEDSAHLCSRIGSTWSAAGVDLTYVVRDQKGIATLHAPGVATRRIHLRWKAALSDDLLVMGDAWERSYGDLAWLPIQPERALPWYCLLYNSGATFGMGVETGASAFAFWQVDTTGVSLWLDLRNGGNGVRLNDRTLSLATIVTAHGGKHVSAFETARELCRRMANVSSSKPRKAMLEKPLFGSNDWYYAYGQNTPEGILRDAALVRELSPAGPVRPCTVIDDGYQNKLRFPDMPKLAEAIRDRGVDPGIWIRPLRADARAKDSLLLPARRYGRQQTRRDGMAYDPTVPEARKIVLDVVREARSWGYDLIKHDFTTYELLGQWGSQMGPSPTLDGWSFQDRGKTNAEIIRELYQDIREAAREGCFILGCNTVGHLSAGIFDGQRTGDDVSGRNWERTRRMGVNTLGFRLPQNGIFFAADADCVPITQNIPWSFTEQWLRVVAASGSILLISPEPGAMGEEQKRAIRAAFQQCVERRRPSEPVDWIHQRTPEEWSDGSSRQSYSWLPPEGATPFGV